MPNQTPNNAIAKFLRDKRRNPIGLVCAVKLSDNIVNIGWSFTAKPDRLPGKTSRKVAWDIALNRAKNGTTNKIPRDLMPLIDEISSRAIRYFKVPAVTLA
jgi:hypothetical protein